eukprot:1162034-Pelagomonas_calceolata.AAC.8
MANSLQFNHICRPHSPKANQASCQLRTLSPQMITSSLPSSLVPKELLPMKDFPHHSVRN